MSFSTKNILAPDNIRAELVSTDDKYLVDYLGSKIPVLIVGREYKNDNVTWKKTDDGRLFAEYSGKFAEFLL